MRDVNLNELIEFKQQRMKKSEVFSFIKEKAVEAGWLELASNPKAEGYIFYSKGETDDKEIWIQLRENYDGSASYFSSTDERVFDVRTMFSYVPDAVAGKNGVSNPVMSNSYQHRVIASVKETTIPIDSLFDVYYHFNKNRLIFALKNIRTLDSCFVMAGRPTSSLSTESKEIGNLSIVSNSYRWSPAVAMGELHSLKTNGYALTPIINDIPRSFTKRSTYMTEIAVGSSTEGFKCYLEGIYALNVDTQLSSGLGFDGDMIIDEFGNEYTLLNCTGSYSQLLKTPYYAICTKIAKSEEGEI